MTKTRQNSKTLPNTITRESFSDACVTNLVEIFNTQYELDKSKDYNPFDYMYLFTFHGNTNNVAKLMSELRKVNFNWLIKPAIEKGNMAKFLNNQHAGYMFVDYRSDVKNKKANGTSRSACNAIPYGAHLHGPLIVHPENHTKFLELVDNYNKWANKKKSKSELDERLASRENRGIHLQRVQGTREDAIAVTSYSMKQVLHDNGYYPGRDMNWDAFGPRVSKHLTFNADKSKGKKAKSASETGGLNKVYRTYDKLSIEDAEREKQKGALSSPVREFDSNEKSDWEKQNPDLLKPEKKKKSSKMGPTARAKLRSLKAAERAAL